MVQPAPHATPQHNIFQDVKDWIVSIPQITRYLFIGTLAFSLGAKLGICSVLQIVLFFEPIYEKYQFWRLFTAHLYSSGQGLIWHVYMLYQQSKDLETGYFASKKADYFWVVVQVMFLLDIAGIYFSMPLLTEAFGMAITYIYSQVKADQIVTFFFGMQFKAMYLPFVLLLWGFLTGGSWELPVMGMAIGHLVYYLEIQYPAKYGRKLIPTPKFIENWFPNSGGVHGVNGPVQPTRTTRDAWGTGHRLGTQ